MPEYTGSRVFCIYPGDVGTEAYSDKYVKWLEGENARLRKQLKDAYDYVDDNSDRAFSIGPAFLGILLSKLEVKDA